MNVFPQPGPPVSTITRELAAMTTACCCCCDSSIPRLTLTCLYYGGGRIKSILEKLSKFEQAAERSKLINYRNFNERIADLRIYRVQFPRSMESRLDFLEIEPGRKILHKMGITKHPIEERVSEVQRDLFKFWILGNTEEMWRCIFGTNINILIIE